MTTTCRAICFSIVFAFVPCLVSCVNGEKLSDPGSEVLPSSIDSGAVIDIQGMTTSRAAHTSTLLPNGKVLIAGGFGVGENAHSSSELFDPSTLTFQPISPMTVARQSHTATLLPNGKVLLVGGFNQDSMTSSELYDPATGQFSPTGSLRTARYGHGAVLLSNGKVLIVGGVGVNWTFLSSAELYDPTTGSFSSTGNMTTPRTSHIATLLNNGKVLIAGGCKDRQSAITIYSSAEIYDPATGQFTTAGSMSIRRYKHDAVLLPDGRVLIVGGSDERDDRGDYRSVEIFDPITGAFRVAGNMSVARYKFQGTSLLLRNGKVLIIGGGSFTEVYDPTTNSFSVASRSVGTIRLFSASTLLPNGEALFTGGYGTNVSSTANAWIFIP